MPKALKVGVVGVGTFGTIHLEAYNAYHRSDLSAICDVNAERGGAKAREYGCQYYSDFAEMFDRGGLDAVSIATPDFLHREAAVRAAEAGLDILLEKPMATTVEDAEAILRAARKEGVSLMVDFHNRFSPLYVPLKESIDRGEMGRPAYVHLKLNDTIYVPTGMLSWSAESSVLWFLGSHVADLSRWLLGSDPERAFCVEGRGVLEAMGISTADFYQSIIQFQSGAVASLENCWILPETHPSVFDMQLEFVGSEGSYNANASHSDMVEKYTREKRENPDVIASAEVHGRPFGFAKFSIWHFVDSILDGKEPLVKGEDGLWATKMVCALLESAKTGKAVPV